MPSRWVSLRSSLMLSSVKPGRVLPLYSLSFWSSVRLAFLGSSSRVNTAHIALEHLDELDDTAVGDIELAIEVERPRVGIRAVDCDLAIVDIAGQLGRVLVLLVLRLEGTDANAILLGEDQPPDADAPDHLA